MEIIREPGLFGTGPRPVHLHSGSPTPYREGEVFRIIPEQADPWLANVQTGCDGFSIIQRWEKEKRAHLIVNGDCYLIHPEQPEDWKLIHQDVLEYRFLTPLNIALITNYSDLFAINSAGTQLWSNPIAFYGIEFTLIDDQFVKGFACYDASERWAPFTICLSDGELLNE